MTIRIASGDWGDGVKNMSKSRVGPRHLHFLKFPKDLNVAMEE